MSTAHLAEVQGEGVAKYRLSPPWRGSEYVIVVNLVLRDGRTLTHIYAANETGPLAVTTPEGNSTLLETVIGHVSHERALARIDYRLE